MGRPRGGVGWVAGLAAVLFGAFSWPFLAHTAYAFGLGPDVPVYLWWSRVAAGEGLSVVGSRPGIPAVLPVLSKSLGLGLVPVTGAFEISVAVAIGLAAAVLARGASSRTGASWTWLLAGLLGGLYAAHLAEGYIANLAFAAALLAAAAALTLRTRRGAVAAALLIGGGGLAHPQFFLVGAAILGGVAVWSALVRGSEREPAPEARADARRIGAALVGGAVLAGAGVLAALVGPARLTVDTSLDAYLRRVGEAATLAETYRARLARQWTGFGVVQSAILGVIGALHLEGFVRRLLVVWIGLTAIAVEVGLVTGRFPAERVLTFAFALPIAAAFGIAWVWRRLRDGHPVLAPIVTIALVVLVAYPSIRTWVDAQPYASPAELRQGVRAARIAVARTEPGTPLVFVVDGDTNLLFRSTAAANLLRAAMPPERAADVYVFAGDVRDWLDGHPTVRDNPVFDRLSRTTFEAVPSRERAALFVLGTFDDEPGALDQPSLRRVGGDVSTTIDAAGGPGASPGGPGASPGGQALPDELEPSDGLEMVLAGLAVLALLTAVGFGWARWTFPEAARSLAAAPALGLAALVIAAVLVERLGGAIGQTGGALVASALAGGGGYGLLLLQGPARPEPRGEVEPGPDE